MGKFSRVKMDTTFRVKQVACGAQHTLLLTTSNMLFAMGSNSEGQLGNGQTTDEFVPTAIEVPQVSENAEEPFRSVAIFAGAFNSAVLCNNVTEAAGLQSTASTTEAAPSALLQKHGGAVPWLLEINANDMLSSIIGTTLTPAVDHSDPESLMSLVSSI